MFGLLFSLLFGSYVWVVWVVRWLIVLFVFIWCAYEYFLVIIGFVFFRISYCFGFDYCLLLFVFCVSVLLWLVGCCLCFRYLVFIDLFVCVSWLFWVVDYFADFCFFCLMTLIYVFVLWFVWLFCWFYVFVFFAFWCLDLVNLCSDLPALGLV